MRSGGLGGFMGGVKDLRAGLSGLGVGGQQGGRSAFYGTNKYAFYDANVLWRW